MKSIVELAVTHYNAGRLKEAELVATSALEVVDVGERADMLNLLGMVAFHRGDQSKAVGLICDAIRLSPAVPDYHLNLGNLHGCDRRPNQALECFAKALRLEPTCHEAYNGIGVTLSTSGRIDEAEVAFRHAIGLRPDYAEAHNHLGAVLQAQGRIDEAIACLREASRLRPEYAEAHFNLGMALLLTGDFATGLPEYEWRRRQPRRPGTTVRTRPLWDGSDPRGRTIAIHCEEGLGDMIQFARYAEALQEMGARVIMECPPAMLGLLTHVAGVDNIIPTGTPLPEHDWHAPVMSLPHLLNTTLGTIPQRVPYIVLDVAFVEAWRRRLADVEGLRVGVCWEGSNDNAFLGRHFPPTLLALLGNLPGVRLISLQKGAGAARTGELSALAPIIEFPLLDHVPGGAFVDTAALIANLDLVVTCDTSIAHLAGALGAPVWVALPFAPDWRWLREREDSPWYPTMRLFRQPSRGDWQAVFDRMTIELQSRLHESASNHNHGSNIPGRVVGQDLHPAD